MTYLADLTIVILAGGLGTRLRPAVKHVPKVLAPVNGTPFLNYVLDRLIDQGGRKVLLCIGHGAEQIQACYDGGYRSLDLKFSLEKEPLGTAGAIRFCNSLVKSEDMLVFNGDTFCDIDLNQFIHWYQYNRFKAAIALVRKRDVSRFGSVEIDSDDRIIQFHEKAKRSGGGYVSAGVYLLNRQIVRKIPEKRKVSMEYEVLPELIGCGLSGYKTTATFIDIGTPDSYRRAQQYFSGYKDPDGAVHRVAALNRTDSEMAGQFNMSAGETK